MTETVLQTKLKIPRKRPRLVPRPDLVDRLNQGLDARLILVSAPAGYGKTTLVANWAQSLLASPGLPSDDTGHPPAWLPCWLSLDEEDDDPARFLTYLVAALQSVVPEVDETALQPLQSPRAGSVSAGLASLINTLEAVQRPIVIVIDDFHVIQEPAINRGMIFLLDHLPNSTRLVIISRSDPSLALSRLRARGQLVEIRQHDLQFSAEETVTFLRESAGLDIGPVEAQALSERVEGWVAGLQMAALALQTRPDSARPDELTRFIRSFSGSDRYILDYLMEEVLQHQPVEIQAFLLHTAVLDRLTASLCDAVLADGPPEQDGQSQDILDQLDQANLFIVPLDNQRRWYRYHRLFADLLRKRLQQQWPGRLPALHQRASIWFEGHGFPGPAVEHALSAGAVERAGHLIEQAAEGMMMRSEIVTLLRWLEQLPGEAFEERPRLAAIYGGALLLQGRPLSEVEHWLQRADSVDSGARNSETVAYQALLATYRLQTAKSMQLAQEAERDLPEDSLFLRSLVSEVKAFVYTMDGNMKMARQAFAEAAEVGRATGSLLVAVGSLCNQAGLLIYQGQLHRAESVYKQALIMATTKEGYQLPIAGKALMGLGELYREWDDLAEAEHLTRQGLDLYLKYGETGVFFGFASLARVKQSQRDFDAAEQLLVQARQSAARFDVTEMDDFLVDCFQVQLWLAEGNVAAAERWASGRAARRDKLPPPLRETEEIILARLHLARGEFEKTLALLRPLATQAERQGFFGRLIKLLVLKALAQQGQMALDAATDTLAQALALATPERFQRVFLDEGKPMAQLLRQAAMQKIAPEFVSQLLAAYGRESAAFSTGETHSHPQPLIEPLSERELEVLQLIAQGLSNRQIAERLFVSLSTVKGHASNIYSKLNASNRTQAVAQARALGLIE